MTHADWLKRWAQRWVDDAKSEIQNHQTVIAELRSSLNSARDDDERDCIDSLIDQHQSIIDTIILSHRQWQRFAKNRWNLAVPDLPQ